MIRISMTTIRRQAGWQTCLRRAGIWSVENFSNDVNFSHIRKGRLFHVNADLFQFRFNVWA